MADPANDLAWKPNWEETRRHFVDWWNHRGLVVGHWGQVPSPEPIEPVENPGEAGSVERYYTDGEWKARWNHWRLAHTRSPADILPIAGVDIGPGSLALVLGSEPTLRMDTVWYNPAFEHEEYPERLPPLGFDPANRWWKAHETGLSACARLAKGRYLVGCPDLIENTDTLASLRGMLRMLEDMIVRPEWVERKVAEINAAWFEAYDRVYGIIRQPDGSSCWSAFGLWGPGKTAKLQCDSSASFSPAMFRRFVVPALTEQCERIPFTMFHLDGEHCIPHLDALLGIAKLGAIEWTPNPKVPGGGDPAWYPLYRRILAAGKSVQAIGVAEEQLVPLLDAVGGRGMYVMTWIGDERQAERIGRLVAPYR